MIDEALNNICNKLSCFDNSIGKVVSDFNLFFSVIIPAFNEERRIKDTLLEWIKFLDAHFRKYEILVVMDGCTDNTVSVVLELARRNPHIVPFVYPKRLGKGGALIEAFKKARGEIIFFTDADNSLHVDEFIKFIEALKNSDLAIGCRYFRGSIFIDKIPVHRLILSRAFNAIIRIFFPKLRGIYDTQCGAKAIHKTALHAVIDELIEKGFAFDINLIYSILRKGFSISNVYVQWRHVEKQSKVSSNIWKTCLSMLLSTIKLRIYFSRLRCLLSTKLSRNVCKFLMKVLS